MLTARLIDAWNEIDGTFAESTFAAKLKSRIEKPEWSPPILTFLIARHGGTVLGSTRAEIHQWEVNLQNATATCNPNYGHRQLRRMDEPFRAGPVAAEIFDAISNRRDDERLKWTADRQTVKVLLGVFISGGFQRTVAGRRKRFREELEHLLGPRGWIRAPGCVPNTYTHPTPEKN
jgi:hypothetical protein